MAILVTGATGPVGRLIVSQLQAAGETVRALVHRDGAQVDVSDVVVGDLADPGSLATAFAGIDRAYLISIDATERPGVAEQLVDVARAAGVRRIVVLSPSEKTGLEHAVEASGLDWTHIRPLEYALNKVSSWAASIRADSAVRAAYPDAPGVPIHELDIATVAAKVLFGNQFNGSILTLTGPEVLTDREQLRLIGGAIGRHLRFDELTPAQAGEELAATGMPPFVIDLVLGHRAKRLESPPQVLDTVTRVTGHAPQTFASWAIDHVDDFR